MSAALCRARWQNARAQYAKTNDRDAYLADTVNAALQFAAAQVAEGNAGLRHLPTAAGLCQYGIKGVVDSISHLLRCPLEHDLSPEEMLADFYRHGYKFLDRDLQAVREIIERLAHKRS